MMKRIQKSKMRFTHLANDLLLDVPKPKCMERRLMMMRSEFWTQAFNYRHALCTHQFLFHPSSHSTHFIVINRHKLWTLTNHPFHFTEPSLLLHQQTQTQINRQHEHIYTIHIFPEMNQRIFRPYSSFVIHLYRVGIVKWITKLIWVKAFHVPCAISAGIAASAS